MKEKECARCYKSLNILYRIKHKNATKNWYFGMQRLLDNRKKITNTMSMVGRLWKGG